jgi:molybdenum ABC transporter molybdate-binding protein
LDDDERDGDPMRFISATRLAASIALSATVLSATVLSATSAWGQEKKSSPELTVAAAADLSSALQEIADRYEKKTGVHLKLSFGASGALTQQIQNGAPFDLFFSADMDYPRQLIAAGAADPASLYQYAVGKVVLWVPADSPLDLDHKGMSVLLDPSVKKIAVANPQHAPYGRAAVAALKHAGMYDQIADRLVLGENVAQAAQFVESGNAQAGFVALAHAPRRECAAKENTGKSLRTFIPRWLKVWLCCRTRRTRKKRRSSWNTSRRKKRRSCCKSSASRCRRISSASISSAGVSPAVPRASRPRLLEA